MPVKDRIGQRFGRLVVQKFAGKEYANRPGDKLAEEAFPACKFVYCGTTWPFIEKWLMRVQKERPRDRTTTLSRRGR